MHLTATRAMLYDLMASYGTDVRLAHRLGMREEAARALCWLSQSITPNNGQHAVLTLGFDDGCPGKALPRSVTSALGGVSLPVRATRASRFAAAHTWVKAENTSHRYLTGSLGAILRRSDQPARLFGLTAGHVFGAAAGARQGDEVRFDFDREPVAPMVGRLLDWQPNFARLPVESTLDAGVAEIRAEMLQPLVARPGEWPVGTSSAFADDRLRLKTRGIEIVGDQVTFVGAWLCLNRDTSRAYLMRDAIGWHTDSPTQPGDSGAPIWNASDELVGIHVGGQFGDEPHSALAVPIARILRWAGSDIVRRGEALQRPALPRSTQPLKALPVPAGLAARHDASSVLARTVYGEARGEGQAGMAAVGHVVLNRVLAKSWWGRDVISVCQKPWQFSCWNLNDPNRAELLKVDAGTPRFRLALDIAEALQIAESEGSRTRADPTDGATHYYAPRLVQTPRWVVGRSPCARIGGHVFFKGVA